MATGFNFQPYIQPYTAPPIEDFSRMGDVLNTRYETSVADMSDLELLANQIKVLPTSQEIKDNMLRDVNTTLTELRERGDLENAAPRIREAARRFANDPNLIQAAENYQNVQKWEEEARQLRLSGQNVLQFIDYNQEQIVDGRLQALRSDNQQQLDYRGRLSQYFDNLQPDNISISESGYGIGPGGIYEQRGSATQRGGIGVERINALVETNLNSYLGTNEGIQQFRKLTELDGYTQEDAVNRIREEMRSAGLERVFTNTSTSTSVSPLESVGLDRQLKLAQLAKATMTKEQQMPLGRFNINRSDLSDAKIGANVPKSELWTNKGIKSLVNFAFKGDDEQKVKGKYELNNVLSNLSTSSDPKVRETAEQYQTLIQRAQDLFGDNADDYLSDVLNPNKLFRGSSNLTAAIANSPNVSNADIASLNRDFRNLRNSSTGFIFDSSFEDAVEKELSNPLTRQIGWMSPKLVGDNAFTAGDRQAWNAATSKEEWDLSNFKIVRGDTKDLDKLEDTRVEITAVSNDVLGGGYGIGYLIRDAEGRQHVAVPKDTGYEQYLEANFLPDVAYILGAPDIVHKNMYKKGIVPGQTKNLQQIADDNGIPVLEDLSNMIIRGGDNGYTLTSGNKEITLSDMYRDFEGGNRSINSTQRLIEMAITSGGLSQKDLTEAEDSNGNYDINQLLRKIQTSSKPVVFSSPYDIYKAYIR